VSNNEQCLCLRVVQLLHILPLGSTVLFCLYYFSLLRYLSLQYISTVIHMNIRLSKHILFEERHMFACLKSVSVCVCTVEDRKHTHPQNLLLFSSSTISRLENKVTQCVQWYWYVCDYTIVIRCHIYCNIMETSAWCLMTSWLE